MQLLFNLWYNIVATLGVQINHRWCLIDKVIHNISLLTLVYLRQWEHLTRAHFFSIRSCLALNADDARLSIKATLFLFLKNLLGLSH